jgi:multiple sugar transport system substrate-binding protein
MMPILFKHFTLLAILMLVIAISGCANSEKSSSSGVSSVEDSTLPKATETAKPPEPVTLKFWVNATLPEEGFRKTIKEPVEKKFPYITLEYVSPTKSIEDLVVAHDVPDLIYHNGPSFLLQDMVGLNLKYDMTEMAKKYKFDLSRLDPSLLDVVKQYTPDGEIIALPAIRQPIATVYNKDIFDKFGVAFPKDGMTWDDAIQLGKKLARTADGVQVFGLKSSGESHLNRLRTHGFFDKNGAVNVQTPEWVQAANTLKAIGDIAPEGKMADSIASTPNFLKAQDTALYAGSLGDMLRDINKTNQLMNWDLVTYPVFKEAPDIGASALGLAYAMTATSPHKDEAFQVIAYLMSDEIQTLTMRAGIDISPLNDSKVLEMFAFDNPSVRAKNWRALVKLKAAKLNITQYDDIANKVMTSKLNVELLKNSGKDVNTLLREATEEIKMQVAVKKN